MGDFRASIKIEIELYDIKVSWKTWVNYDGLSGEVAGVDDRVIDFFRDVFSRAYSRYQNDLDGIDNKTIEQEERAMLARLKEKYENAN